MDPLTSFSAIIDRTAPQAVLVDASGVLYNDDGMVPGVAEALSQVRQQGLPVFVVTNNTTASPADIADFLDERGIPVPESQVISSGLGLSLDPDLCNLLRDRVVCSIGSDRSADYVRRCPGTTLTTHPGLADIVVLAASSEPDFDRSMAALTEVLRSHPDIPVICINPDFYVQTRDVRHPVIGYYADLLAQQTGVRIRWMGKPHAAFSPVVRTVLERHHITPEKTVFLDDNYHNVLQLQTDLGLTGVLVWKTGLSFSFSREDLQKPPLTRIHYVIEQIS